MCDSKILDIIAWCSIMRTRRGQLQMEQAMSKDLKQLEVGQVWTYKTRPGEEGSAYLVVGPA